MKRIFFVVALAGGCSGSSGDGTTLPRAKIMTCSQACSRIQQCAAKTHRPSHKPRMACEESCSAMATDSQRAYAKQVGAETDCNKVEPFVFLE